MSRSAQLLRAVARRVVGRLPRSLQSRLRAARRVSGGPADANERLARAEAALRAEKARASKAEAASRAEKARAEQARTQRDQARAAASASRAAERAAAGNVARWARAYREMRASVLGVTPEDLGPADPTAPTVVERGPDRSQARRQRQLSALAERLIAGDPLEDAVAAVVRDLLVRHLPGRAAYTAQALSHSLLRCAGTRVAGHLGAALVADAFGNAPVAWESFAHVPVRVWHRLAAEEYFRNGFSVDRTAAIDAARRLLADCPPEVPPMAWLSVARCTLGAGEVGVARDLFALAEDLSAADPEAWAGAESEVDWLRQWLGRARRPSVGQPMPPGHVAFAVFDHKQPDRAATSNNIDDYLQTLRDLGHLVRHQNLRFNSEDGLGAVVTQLQRRVQRRLRLDTRTRDVTLVSVNRDATTFDPVPPVTWTIVSGWRIRRVGGRYDLPLNPNLRPIFTGIHCDSPEMLTPQAVEYLCTYGPVGCLDWTTVELLLSAGVPAYFSGDVEATDLYTKAAAPVGPRSAGDAAPTRPDGDRVRDGSLAANLHISMEFLERGGSADAIDDHRSQTPHDALATVATAITAIIDGRSEQEVYHLWRESCAHNVAVARARREPLPPLPPASIDTVTACAAVRVNATTIERRITTSSGPEVHVALALDGNLKKQLGVVITAMIDNSSRPLHLWITCRDHDGTDFSRFAATFPEVTVTWLPCDRVGYGSARGLRQNITVSGLDRLLLPELLLGLDRVVYHDIDALPVGDIAELYDWDLEGQPLAAHTETNLKGPRALMRSMRRLQDDPATAHDLIRRTYSRFEPDYVGFNSGVLVLDLTRMRSDRFCQEFVPYAEYLGMDDQDVLNFYAGRGRVTLPPQWNALVTLETIPEDPQIIHWAGPLKPWLPRYAPYQEVWTTYVDRLRIREETAESAESLAGPGPTRGED